MMDKNCRNCNEPLLSNAKFCVRCGTVVQTDVVSKKNKEKKQHNEKKQRKKKKLWIIPVLLILLLIGAAVVTALFMFPAKISITTSSELFSNTGRYDKVTIKIESNQPISDVTVTLGEKDAKGSCEINTFDATFTSKKFNIPEGDTYLTVTVKTWFGKQEQVFTLTYEYDGIRNDIGYSSNPEEDSLYYISEDRYLVSNELLVVFKETASKSEIDALVSEYGGEIVGQFYLMNEYQLRFDCYGEWEINSLYESILAEEIVDDVFYNMHNNNSLSITPSDPEFDDWDVSNPSGNNWWLECVDAPGAWNYMDQISSIRVGVLDSFLDYDHEDLQVNSNRVHMIPGPDFATIADLHDYFDETFTTHSCTNRCAYCSIKNHGTHCSGIVGALENNNKGIAGVNWNSELYFSTWWYYGKASNGTPQISVDEDTFSSYSQIARLVMSGCRVVSISLGSSSPSSPDAYEANNTRHFERLMTTLENANYDFIICKSAGNSDDDVSNYSLNRIMTGSEAGRNHVIIVGAVEDTLPLNDNFAKAQYNLAYYSNYGDLIDISAPGSAVYSTVFGNDYEYKDGTSMATPLVAGIASMVYGANPDLNCRQVKEIICNSYTQFAYKNMKMYGVINARVAVEKALNITTTTAPEVPDVGFISGLVQDAVTGEAIDSGIVLITNNATSEIIYVGVNYGGYETYLDVGIYTMVFTADGYQDETIYNVEITSGVMSYNVLLNMVEDAEEDGWISGRIIDAFDASSIPYAYIKIYAGVNNTSGTPVYTTYSDGTGYYSATLAPGNYTIKVEADQYTTGTAQVLVIPGSYNSEQNCTLTPILENGEIRVVLTWGEYPSDLDSHLVGPDGYGDKFHVYYDSKNYYYQNVRYVNLDVDDTTSYGPETTSVYYSTSGTYTFYVHNYSDRSSYTSNGIATSGAQIKLYIPGRSEPYVFNAPNEAGTLWEVFTITDGVVTPVNTMSYEYSPRNVGE